ncbi:C39 family peptidase [Marinobacteraceae bacterium S3BR75-40.1]
MLRRGLLALLSLASGLAMAGSVAVPMAGGSLEVAVTSFQESRYQTIMRQQKDFSCGSAALASLLSYHYDFPVSELDVFKGMLTHADAEKVRREGFSMLDMKRYLEVHGYTADGFRLPLDDLREKAGVPAIVLLNLDGFRHFVVLKGVRAHEVLVGDPTRGLRIMPRNEFETAWNGVVFLIRSQLSLGREGFNRPVEWHKVARMTSAPDTPSLGNLMLALPLGLEW